MTELNAKLLMIGDWIVAIDDDGIKHPCRVATLQYDSTNNRDDFDIDFACTGFEPEWPNVMFTCEPIPLTAEILKKNGWECYNTYRKYSKSNVTFELREQKDGGFTIEVDAYEYGCGAFAFINYVHELQHALVLCGFDNDIKLED